MLVRPLRERTRRILRLHEEESITSESIKCSNQAVIHRSDPIFNRIEETSIQSSGEMD
jgi:hypothetical protein